MHSGSALTTVVQSTTNLLPCHSWTPPSLAFMIGFSWPTWLLHDHSHELTVNNKVAKTALELSVTPGVYNKERGRVSYSLYPCITAVVTVHDLLPYYLYNTLKLWHFTHIPLVVKGHELLQQLLHRVIGSRTLSLSLYYILLVTPSLQRT